MAGSKQNDAPETVHVRLTARRWLRRLPDTDPPEFEVINQGDELEITKKEYDLLVANPIRHGVEEVEQPAPATNTTSSAPTTTTTNSASS